MHVTIRPLDTACDAELAQFNELDRATDDASYGGSQNLSIAQRRASCADTPYWRTERWVAIAEPMEGGEVMVGRAAMFLSLQDNLDTVNVGVAVHPAYRGHGVATALLDEALLPAIHASGRHLVEAYAEIPAGADPDDQQQPALRLAQRLGITRKNVAVCRTLALPLDDGLLTALQAQVDEKIGDYRIELWDEGVPEEHLVAYGALLHQLDLDEPDEDVEYEAPEHTPERIRIAEQRVREAGMQAILAVAVAPDGSFVGNSEVLVHTDPASTLAWQENTLVMPEHRGHRLGLGLKLATHRLIRERAPQVRAVTTFNSHVNPWMIGINEQLGYQVAFQELVLQGRPDLSGFPARPARAMMTA